MLFFNLKIEVLRSLYSVLQNKMIKIKRLRTIIILECLHCIKFSKIRGIARYKTVKNKKNTSKRLQLKKFCIFSKTHEIFKELK